MRRRTKRTPGQKLAIEGVQHLKQAGTKGEKEMLDLTKLTTRKGAKIEVHFEDEADKAFLGTEYDTRRLENKLRSDIRRMDGRDTGKGTVVHILLNAEGTGKVLIQAEYDEWQKAEEMDPSTRSPSMQPSLRRAPPPPQPPTRPTPASSAEISHQSSMLRPEPKGGVQSHIPQGSGRNKVF